MKSKSLFINENLELRLPDENFAEELFTIVDTQRNYLGQWLPWVEYTKTIENSIEFLKNSILFNQGGQRLTTFIFCKQKLVGSVILVKISKKNKSSELGYWVSQDVEGQGLATQSCKRLIKYVFSQMDIHRIEINAITENKKSIAVAKKLGFSYEGNIRDGFFFKEKFYDLERFSLLKTDSAHEI